MPLLTPIVPVMGVRARAPAAPVRAARPERAGMGRGTAAEIGRGQEKVSMDAIFHVPSCSTASTANIAAAYAVSPAEPLAVPVLRWSA